MEIGGGPGGGGEKGLNWISQRDFVRKALCIHMVFLFARSIHIFCRDFFAFMCTCISNTHSHAQRHILLYSHIFLLTQTHAQRNTLHTHFTLVYSHFHSISYIPTYSLSLSPSLLDAANAYVRTQINEEIFYLFQEKQNFQTNFAPNFVCLFLFYCSPLHLVQASSNVC